MRLIGCRLHVFYLFGEHGDYFYVIQLLWRKAIFGAIEKAPFSRYCSSVKQQQVIQYKSH